jgi:hypothetical protein
MELACYDAFNDTISRCIEKRSTDDWVNEISNSK